MKLDTLCHSFRSSSRCSVQQVSPQYSSCLL